LTLKSDVRLSSNKNGKIDLVVLINISSEYTYKVPLMYITDKIYQIYTTITRGFFDIVWW